MTEKIVIDGVELILQTPDIIPNMKWIGQETYMSQLLAAWLMVDPQNDLPMNPQVLGKPGVGKTTLAYSAALNLDLPIYIYQCTVDTRPEDLLISPVISKEGTIQYHASALVSAMIKGGVCILDEANRMAEKSWASLAPLLDQRRYIESIIAGIKIPAHPSFRIVTTLNEDASTFEIPEYIHSRLQPQIFIDFPDRNEEIQILKFNLPYARKEIIIYAVNFLQNAHQHNKNYTIRDGINICRYYLKLELFSAQKKKILFAEKEISTNQKPHDEHNFNINLFYNAIGHILGPEAQEFYRHSEDSNELKKLNEKFRDMFDQLNSVFFEEKMDEIHMKDESLEEDINELEFFEKMDDSDLYDMNNPDDPDQENEKPYYSKSKTSLDKVIRIIEEKDDKIESSDSDQSKKPAETQEDPNEIIRNFLKRREKERINKKQKDSKKNGSTSTGKEE